MSGFHLAKSIHSVLNEIDDQQLVLPAVQREFVWSEQKNCELFDSLMLGYPIGGFLFWKIMCGKLRRVFAQSTPACYHAFGMLIC